MDEFSVIEKYFVPLTMGRAEAAGLKDDGAVLSVPDGFELAVTSDTLGEGVHFMVGESPDVIARKSLRVNLSDLASMAAKPLCYQLNISFPEAPEEAWLEVFSRALLEENERYGVFCSGGDTTCIKGGYLSISVTAMGLVPQGKATRRCGARDGDAIVLTGSVGDAALGLKLLLAGREKEGGSLYKGAIARYRVPEPRVGLEGIMQRYVNGAVDISDGLIADCMHVAHASGLGAEIDLGAVKFSNFVQIAIENGEIEAQEAVSGGDDYELIMAVSKENLSNLIFELKKSKLKPMVIGTFVDNGLKMSVIGDDMYRIDEITKGWKHF